MNHPGYARHGMFKVRLERIRELSESTRDFRFVRTDGKDVGFRPGEFFRFVFTDAAGEFERSYSLCNYPLLDGPYLDLVISEVAKGRATKYLFNCREGIEADVTGPFGRLLLPQQAPARLLMVATSVGLAPFMPMLTALATGNINKVVLLLGVRDRSEFIYGEELLAYRAAYPFFELRLCLSREKAKQAHEYDGYVTAQLPGLSPDKERDHCLLCGNPRMIDDAWKFLKGGGFRARQVVREKYVFAKEVKSGRKAPTEEEKRLIIEKAKKYS